VKESGWVIVCLIASIPFDEESMGIAPMGMVNQSAQQFMLSSSSPGGGGVGGHRGVGGHSLDGVDMLHNDDGDKHGVDGIERGVHFGVEIFGADVKGFDAFDPEEHGVDGTETGVHFGVEIVGAGVIGFDSFDLEAGVDGAMLESVTVTLEPWLARLRPT